MAIYEYKGVDSKGKKVSGVMDADSERAARIKIRKLTIFPTELKLEGSRGQGFSLTRDVDFSKYWQRVKTEEIASMTRQLSTLLSANVPLVDSLGALRDQVDNPKLKSALSAVREKVVEGTRLADALKSQPEIFNDLYVHMINAGESAGALDVVCERLADLTEKQAKLKSKISGALVYPIIMGVIGIGLVSFLMVFVIPKVTKIFDDMGATLPLVTRFLVGLSSFLTNYWYLVLLLLVAGIAGFRRWVKTEKGRTLYDIWSLKIPIFGHLLRLVAIARFARTLSTLLHSGVQLLNGLEIVKNIVQNRVLMESLEMTRVSVREGESLAEPLRRSGQYPPMVIQMIMIGEKTGELEKMLMRVADAYEAQVDNTVSSLTTILEPLMILFMGGIVAFIVLSIMLPILQINQLGV